MRIYTKLFIINVFLIINYYSKLKIISEILVKYIFIFL